MTLIALLWLCFIAEALALSHDSGWRYSSDGRKKAGVGKHREGEWGWPAICQGVEKFAVFKKTQTTLKWLGQSGFSRYGKDLKVDWKKYFGFTVDCSCNFSSAQCYSLGRALICGVGNAFQVTECYITGFVQISYITGTYLRFKSQKSCPLGFTSVKKPHILFSYFVLLYKSNLDILRIIHPTINPGRIAGPRSF